jgi:transcriptional regulator with XRE-family HTH domain
MKKEKRAYNRIKVVLAEKGKTNEWLASKLGNYYTTVSRWCTNEAQPTIQTFAKIAELLDVDISELLNRTKEK